jgi:hypothetical protein
LKLECSLKGACINGGLTSTHGTTTFEMKMIYITFFRKFSADKLKK